jgi:hypothetical protein
MASLNFIILLAIIFLLLIAIRIIKANLSKHTQGRKNVLEQDETSMLLYKQQASHVKESLESLYVKLEEYSREVLSKLDTKILILHNLILDADKKIYTLQNALNTPPKNENNVPPKTSEIEELHKKVYQLYEKKLKPEEIAKQLNLQVSEVQLILALKDIQNKE